MGFLSKTVAVVTALLSFSCGNDVQVLSDQKLLEDIQHVASRIDELIADRSCDSTDQCQYIEYGHKPCGGPADFKIYSTKNTDSELLLEYADEYFQLTREFNQRNNLSSDCSIEIPPSVTCQSVCQES